jgi:hypothetical protein
MPESFDVSVYEYRPRKGPKCSSRPDWLKKLKDNGTTLSLDAIWRQAGRHFADSLDPDVVGFAGTSRQLATETAWRLVSMLRPTVDATTKRLELTKPGDLDIQRLGMEILGVGGSLELLRRVGAIDARTLKKRAGRFDFEAYSRGGKNRIWIEAKGTLDSPSSRQKARGSIQKKINHPNKQPRKKRSYDQRLGVIMLGWPAGAHGGEVDFEIADPPGGPGGDPMDALSAVAAFYARTFQLVGVQGAVRFWEFSKTPDMDRATRRSLFQTDRRMIVSSFSRVSLTMTFTDELTIDFGGSFWRTSAVPFKRDEIESAGLLLDYCYVGVDKRVVQTIGGDAPLELLDLVWTPRQGRFDVQLDEDVLVPEGSRERRFSGMYHLSDDGLLYVWSNVVPSTGVVDVREPA